MQQASLAKFGLYGMPKFEKTLEFGNNNFNFIESENYFSRLSYIRKNYYLTNKFSPFFLNRHNFYNKYNFILYIDNFEKSFLIKYLFNIEESGFLF